MSPTDYQLNVCEERCHNSVKVFGPETSMNIQCFDCECQKPACEIYDICCAELSGNQISSRDSLPSPAPPKLYCDQSTVRDFYFLYIRSCPGSYHGNNETRRLCIEDVSVAETTTESFMRVIDTETQVVYYNLYCAKCNNVTK
ncbi:hypothetical protein Bpfe_014586, partial [Biomphalaria pfeifferi]